MLNDVKAEQEELAKNREINRQIAEDNIRFLQEVGE
jgi:hypothetical protein